MNRRDLLKSGLSAAMLVSMQSYAAAGPGHVVIVGGGFGGATVAKYLRMWSHGAVRVTLIERHPVFISCPMSNLVIAGAQPMSHLTKSYTDLKAKWGVQVVFDEVMAIDAESNTLKLKSGAPLRYDRLVLSPGVDFMYDDLPGMQTDKAQAQVLHAWKAGDQTIALRKQLEAMPDGGVYAITVPRAPYKCPPGPYERACLVANYFKNFKPKSKVLILDANAEITSKKALFEKVFKEIYPGIIEYRANAALLDVDASSTTAILDFEQVRADVLNVIPPQQAGVIARNAGLTLVNKKWVGVDWLTMLATNSSNIHVIGDATFPSPLMPKSAHMANQQGKLAASAILSLLAGEEPNQAPTVMNTCYSFVDGDQAIHVAAVYQYDAATKLLQPVKGAGGVSAAPTAHEGVFAKSWAENIWADSLS